jgi:iron complex outermembrane receptor protein
MRLSVAVAVVSLSIIGLAVADDVRASIRRPTNIPAQGLGPALQALANDRNFQVVYVSEEVANVRTQGAAGEFTSDEALRQLLRGTGLTYRYLDENTITILPVSMTSNPGTAPTSPDSAPASNSSGNTQQEGKRSSSDGFRLAQVDQGQTPGPSTVEKQAEQASKKKPVILEEIIVTGSRIPTTAQEGAQPVRVYTQQQIDQSGQGTIAEFLSTLPDVSLNSIDSSLGNYADQTSVRLHGLPVGTTLVLLNGRRVQINNYGFFDLNNIPVSAVERIEVLPVGASAIYGADSLAGAVNIVLRDRFDGLEASTRYGRADGGLGQTDASLAWGKSWERGSITLVGSFDDAGELLASERTITANSNPVLALFGEDDVCNPGTVYSLNGGNLPGLSSPVAAIPSGLSGKPTIAAFSSTAGTVHRCGFAGDIFPPRQREGVLASANYAISDGAVVFSEVLASHESVRSNSGNLINLFNVFGSTLPATNAYNPFGQDVGISYTYPGLPDRFDRTTTFVRPLLGVRGSLGSDWNYELAGFLSQDHSRVRQSNGGLDFGAVLTALASSNPATAFNPFASGVPGSPQTLASLTPNPPSLLYFDSQNVSVEASLRGSLVHLPSGPLVGVFGAEFDRSKIYTDTQTPSATTAPPPVTDRRSAYALFTEERVPLLAKTQNSVHTDRLAITLAGRFDHTNDYGNKTTEQGAVEWRPIESLLIRGGYALSYEAPLLTQLDGAPGSFTTGGYVDPFRNNEPVNNVLFFIGPNRNLKPETGGSRILGLVYASKVLPGLEASVTYWSIYIKNYINSPNPVDLINYPNLFPNGVTRAPPTPQDIQNGLPGRITAINDLYFNFGDLKVAGFDFDMKYDVHTGFGQFTPAIALTETYRFDSALSPSLPTVDYVGVGTLSGVGFVPRWKGTATLGWALGPYTASVDGRYISRYTDFQDFVPNTHELGSFWLCDLNFGYAVGKVFARPNTWLAGSYIAVGAVNLFNRLPQPAYTNTGFDFFQGDIRGRFLYGQLGLKF